MRRGLAGGGLVACIVILAYVGSQQVDPVAESAAQHAMTYQQFAANRCVRPMISGNMPDTSGLGGGDNFSDDQVSFVSPEGFLLTVAGTDNPENGAYCIIFDHTAIPLVATKETMPVYAKVAREVLGTWVRTEFAKDTTLFPTGCSPYDLGVPFHKVLAAGAAPADSVERTLQVRVMAFDISTVFYAHTLTPEEVCA